MNDTTRIGCLHAHHGNIAYLEEALAPYAVVVSHFVDPALVRRIANDADFSPADAERRVRGQIAWMAESGLDGIIVTCTAYAAALPEEPIDGVAAPIITIDEPLFAAICQSAGPQAILFTNPGTVEGTMRRLMHHAATIGATIEPHVELIPDVFDLFMAGRQVDHDGMLAERLGAIAADGQYGAVFAAQLSMTTAARRVDAQGHRKIGNPLDALAASVAERCDLRPAARGELR